MTDHEPEPQHFTLWNVFAAAPTRPPLGDDAADELATFVRLQPEVHDVTVRGVYDLSGLRAGADVMVWFHGTDPIGLQAAARSLRRLEAFRGTIPVWHALGVHREAEFTRSHVPAFARGIAPASWLTVYPFNRSYEWYLLPEDERHQLLAEHGRAGAAYKGVLTNTVSAFALGDYEWILPLEAEDPVELVDLMRTLRATGARLHVREEIPFFTGRRIEPQDIKEILGA